VTFALTVDIGGTKCAAAITSDLGVEAIETWPTSGSVENLNRVVDFYRGHRDSGGQPAVAVGVCFGGPVDHASAVVTRSVHVPGWRDFDFRAWSLQNFGLPAAVDNDANVGVLAELKLGGHSAENLMYVTVSTGIGAGVVVDGRVLRGATNDAGELGHIRISDDARQCGCGRTGCFERLCSGYWIEVDNGKPASDLFANDEFLKNYCNLFARGLASAVLLYNPAVVVLGGGVSRVGARLTTQLTDSLQSELASWKHLTPRITTSRFDGEGVHLGAKELVRDLL
jgi:glucokinase